MRVDRKTSVMYGIVIGALCGAIMVCIIFSFIYTPVEFMNKVICLIGLEGCNSVIDVVNSIFGD